VPRAIEAVAVQLWGSAMRVALATYCRFNEKTGSGLSQKTGLFGA
jgi:hypothetical protein